jgi:hypothetical protein
MEVTAVTTTGTSQIVGNIQLRYSVPSVNGVANEMSASIVRNEKHAGFFSANRNGMMNFSFPENHGFSDADVKRIVSQALQDASSVFEKAK